MRVVYFVFWYVKQTQKKKKKKSDLPTLFFFYVTPIKQFFFLGLILKTAAKSAYPQWATTKVFTQYLQVTQAE